MPEKRDSIRVDYRDGKKIVYFTPQQGQITHSDVTSIERAAKELGAELKDPNGIITRYHQQQLACKTLDNYKSIGELEPHRKDDDYWRGRVAYWEGEVRTNTQRMHEICSETGRRPEQTGVYSTIEWNKKQLAEGRDMIGWTDKQIQHHEREIKRAERDTQQKISRLK